jgi:broad specificity phosphatase PhoE
VVVCHGGVIEQLMKMVHNYPPGARLRLRTENCSITEAEFRGGAWHLLRYNDRAPLDATTQREFVSYVDRQES